MGMLGPVAKPGVGGSSPPLSPPSHLAQAMPAWLSLEGTLERERESSCEGKGEGGPFGVREECFRQLPFGRTPARRAGSGRAILCNCAYHIPVGRSFDEGQQQEFSQEKI